jgi:Na+/H+ antiporter NhaD/arsenite permease-like protein
MTDIAVLIFLLTYIGVALGEVPGLALDRTGIALLGALAMVVSGVVSEKAALLSVDYPTIVLLYALMVVSGQLRLGGFYTWVALKISRLTDKPAAFLFIVMMSSAVLSAIMVNDIICLAFTPILAVAMLRAGLNPIPYLIGLAVSSNIGSAATMIGNPQNMLIGQVGRLHFGSFLLWCAPPAILSLLLSYLLIAFLYRGRFKASPSAIGAQHEVWPPLDRHQSMKGLVATAILMVLFFTPIPREMAAMTIAGLLLCSRRMQTKQILDLVDWHLITLFIGLFVVIEGIESTNLPALSIEWLKVHGIDIGNLYVFAIVSNVLSNLVSNVPATMVLVKFTDAATPVPSYVLALAATFAGNLFTIGSIANLIVIEQAKIYGIHISFREHARVGVPVTLVSMAVLLIWIWVRTAQF